jgi:hypothetical protein
MLARLLLALRGYFADADDPTPGVALVGDPAFPQGRDNERLLRIYARLHVEQAQLIQDLRQRVAALEAKVP